MRSRRSHFWRDNPYRLIPDGDPADLWLLLLSGLFLLGSFGLGMMSLLLAGALMLPEIVPAATRNNAPVAFVSVTLAPLVELPTATPLPTVAMIVVQPPVVPPSPTPWPTATPLPTATFTAEPTWTSVVPLPAVPATIAPTMSPPTVVPSPTPAVAYEPTLPPFTCIGGCATPPTYCVIKGNVNSHGEWIYHTPESRTYSSTDIKPEEGDAWFCTEQEAFDAGFRAAQD